jgi:hypothetical protein
MLQRRNVVKNAHWYLLVNLAFFVSLLDVTVSAEVKGFYLLELHWLAHPFTITLTSHTRLQPRLIQTAPTPHSIDLLHSSRQPRFSNPGMIEPIGSTLPIPRFSHTLLHPCLTQRPFIPQSDDIWHWVIHLVLIGLMGLTGSIGLTGQRGSTGKTPLPLQTRLHPSGVGAVCIRRGCRRVCEVSVIVKGCANQCNSSNECPFNQVCIRRGCGNVCARNTVGIKY